MPVSCGKKGESFTAAPLVALASDLGSRDGQVAQMKGGLLSLHPNLRILDLNHDIQTSALAEASYLFDKAAATFPVGTIFVVAVEPGPGPARKPLLIQTREGKFYIGPDNGIFTHVIEREQVELVVELNNPAFFRQGQGEFSRAFQGRDIYAPVAAHLAGGTKLPEFGPKLKEIIRLKSTAATTLGNKTNGQVVHADRYGNLITNIRQENLSSQTKSRLLKIVFKGRTLSLPFLQNSAEAQSDRLFCLINSDGEFEIVLRDGSAAAMTGLKAGDPVIVQH